MTFTNLVSFKRRQPFFLKLFFIPIFFLYLFCPSLEAQDCPPNIDFENGSFDNWVCYTGNTAAVNNENQINLTVSGPVSTSHEMIPANSGRKDPYGGFPVNCPNGSGYSIKLGNDSGGGQAEGVSYQFTIPRNKPEYSLIYHYAVVFQDPFHQLFQQPRMVVEVVNVTDNQTISCSSFTFIPFGTLLPGFFESSTRSTDGTSVWCKNWSAVSVNLDGLAGKEIRLFFKTADCTFRRHFGYAYIDVNSECSSEFVGATFCPDDTAVNVVAPYGYQGYRWFNKDFSQVLGDKQSIRFFPPPASGTTIAVEVTPYDGYGCTDTFYAKLVDTLTVTAFAGPDQLYCGGEPLLIGSNPKPGLVYSWSPDVGLSNANTAHPLASPLTTTSYTLSVRNSGGGCLNTDRVVITSSSVDSSLTVLGKAVYCLENNDSCVLLVNNASSIQWFKNDAAIAGANNRVYKVAESGTYRAQLVSEFGCDISTRNQQVFIDRPLPGIRYPISYAVTNEPYQLQARTFGIETSWNPRIYLDNPATPLPNFRNDEDQEYTIRIETETGCITVDTLMVKVVAKADIMVPNAFTPNGDGRNDVLRPALFGIKKFNYFRVYNRWGVLMLETKTINAGWDGKYNGRLQATETYVWVAEGIGVDGRRYLRKGTATLIR